MLQSPFRYPGGKAEFAPLIEQFIIENQLVGRPYVEAFAGGAGVALHLLSKRVVSSVTLIERDPLVYSFWASVTSRPAELCERIWALDVSLNSWQKFQKFLSEESAAKYTPVELGLAGIFFNRCNFSGILHAGPIGGMTQGSAYSIGCRFNKEKITAQICDIARYRDRIEVVRDDACRFLDSRKRSLEKSGSIVYADPPYFNKGKRLYRYHFKHDDHEAFSDIITALECPWFVSYDDSEHIAELFQDFNCTIWGARYSAKGSKAEGELLATNYELPAICHYKQTLIC